MKLLKFIILLVGYLWSFNINIISKNNSAMKMKNKIPDTIKKEVFNKYIGKEVFHFLLDSNIRKYSYITLSGGAPFRLHGAFIRINKDELYEIEIEYPKHQKAINHKSNFSLELFYYEKIYSIIYYYKDKEVYSITDK